MKSSQSKHPAQLSVNEIDALLAARRAALAGEAARIYLQTKSLRKTAAKLQVSHETVRALLRAAASPVEVSHAIG